MGTFELIPFANADELARGAAAAWLEAVASANRAGASHHVALSGGRIARNFFAAVAQQSPAGGTGLPAVHFFWSDERCVPPDNPESNYAAARELVFVPLGIPDVRVHRIRGEDPPAAAAAAAEAEIRRQVPVRADRQPVLDLVLLGLGEDGHVASLFPGETEAARAAPEVYRPVVAMKPPPRRITMGYGAIAAAKQVWVLASGAGKEAALCESLRADGRSPLARVVQMRGLTRVWTSIPNM